MVSKRMIRYCELLQNITNKLQFEIQSESSEGKEMQMTETELKNRVYDVLIKVGIKEENIWRNVQKFPDFIIKDVDKGEKVGVEVKKTDSAKWEVVGRSVYESLKNDVDEIYVVMAKFGEGNPEVRFRKYEECIADLRVTHSLRFFLNMNLEEGADYLTAHDSKDLLELSGDELNKRIRQLLRSNKSTWWSEAETTAFADLSMEEKDAYFVDGVVLFPEVFGGNYERFTPWLIYSCLVWCKNVRDVFSAGGTQKVNAIGTLVSAVMNRAVENIDDIKKRIDDLTDEEVQKFWGKERTWEIDKRQTWVSMMKSNLRFSNALIANNKKNDIYKELPDTEISEKIKEVYCEYVCSLLELK